MFSRDGDRENQPEVFTGIKHSYLEVGIPKLGLYVISL